MSDALVWHLIRDNNCFLQKRGRTSRDGEVQFSCEPGNLMGVNTFKYSGLANANTTDIALKGNKVTMKRKDSQKMNKPNTSLRSVKASKFSADKVYRRDLAATASVRAKKLRSVAAIRGAGAKKAKVLKSVRNSKRKLIVV